MSWTRFLAGASLLTWGVDASATPVPFNIPPQPLASALQQFGVQSREQLVFSARKLATARSKGIRGIYEPDVALTEILAGSTFRYRKLAQGFAIVGYGATPNAVPTRYAAATQSNVVTDQSAPVESSGSEVADIIVTAQKREESASRVGISITSFGGQDLGRLRVTNTQDLIKLVPGFTFAQSGLNTPIYTLRGVGFNTVQLGATSPVGIYFDEVSYAYPYMAAGPLLDAERVEVLKGPQGTLYGRNTTGGLVNYISRRPSDSFEAGVTLDLGNYQTHNVEAYVSGPLTPTLGARFAVRTENSDKGWQKSVTRPDDRLGEKNRFAARGMITWEPTPSASFTLTGSYWRDKSDPLAAQAVAFVPLDPSPSGPQAAVLASLVNGHSNRQADWVPDSYPGPDPYAFDRPALGLNSKFYSIALRGDIDLADKIKLTSLTSYNHLKRSDMLDSGGTGQAEITSSLQTGSIKSIQQELRLSGDMGQFNWIVGGYYAHDKSHDNRNLWIRDTGAFFGLHPLVAGEVFGPHNFTPEQIEELGGTSTQITNQSSTTKSVFGNVQWAMSDQFKLTVGARYTDDKTRYSGCFADLGDLSSSNLYNYAFGGILGLPNLNAGAGDCLTFHVDPVLNVPVGYSGLVHRTLKEDNVSARVNVDWTPNPDLLLYASVGQGFKSGAFPSISIVYDTAAVPYKQEKVIAYEAGVKAKLFDRSMQFNASAFYYDYRNKQTQGRVLIPVFVTTEIIVNIPKSEVYGVEADLNWRVTRDLSLRASGSYIKTKIKNYVGFDEAANPFDFKGFQFSYVPKFQTSGAILYNTPLTSNYNLEASVDASYQSKSQGTLTADPRFTVRGYALVNGSIGLAAPDGRWKAALWGRNLFNKYYWSGTYLLLDSVVRFPGMARTYGLTLSYNFR